MSQPSASTLTHADGITTILEWCWRFIHELVRGVLSRTPFVGPMLAKRRHSRMDRLDELLAEAKRSHDAEKRRHSRMDRLDVKLAEAKRAHDAASARESAMMMPADDGTTRAPTVRCLEVDDGRTVVSEALGEAIKKLGRNGVRRGTLYVDKFHLRGISVSWFIDEHAERGHFEGMLGTCIDPEYLDGDAATFEDAVMLVATNASNTSHATMWTIYAWTDQTSG